MIKNPEPGKAEEVGAEGHDNSSQMDIGTPDAQTVQPAAPLEGTQARTATEPEESTSMLETVPEGESEQRSEPSVGTTNQIDVLTKNVESVKMKTTDYKHMGTAARKRFKRAMEQGLSREAALKAALEQKGANPASTGDKPSYSKVLTSQRLGVVPEEPSQKIAEAELTVVKKAILKAVLENKDEAVRPEFEGMALRNGWIAITCTNEATSGWLKRAFPEIKAACDLKIKLVEPEDFPKSFIINGYFAESQAESNANILGYIAAQNPLKATSWAVVSRVTEGKTEHLVLGVDEESYRTLTDLGGRIAYMMGHTRLALGKKRNNATESSQVPKKPKVDEKPTRAAQEPVASTSGTKVPPVKRHAGSTVAKRLTQQGAVKSVPTPKVGTSGKKTAPPAVAAAARPKKSPPAQSPTIAERVQNRRGSRAARKQGLITASFKKTDGL